MFGLVFVSVCFGKILKQNGSSPLFVEQQRKVQLREDKRGKGEGKGEGKGKGVGRKPIQKEGRRGEERKGEGSLGGVVSARWVLLWVAK